MTWPLKCSSLPSLLPNLPVFSPITISPCFSCSDTRRGHFKLNPKDQDSWYDGRHTYEFIDLLMEQIPGKDNYDAAINEFVRPRSFQSS